MRTLLLVFLIYCFSVTVEAQLNIADSFEQQISTAKQDTAKVSLLNSASRNYTFTNPKKATHLQKKQYCLQVACIVILAEREV